MGTHGRIANATPPPMPPPQTSFLMPNGTMVTTTEMLQRQVEARKKTLEAQRKKKTKQPMAQDQSAARRSPRTTEKISRAENEGEGTSTTKTLAPIPLIKSEKKRESQRLLIKRSFSGLKLGEHVILDD